MSKQLEALQKAKAQLVQLQLLSDEIRDACLSKDGFAGDLTQNLKLVETANSALQDLKDKWPTVEAIVSSVLDREAGTVRSQDTASKAWQHAQAEQWQKVAKSWSSEALKVVHSHLKSHIHTSPHKPAKRRKTGQTREQKAAQLKAVVSKVQALCPAVQVHYCSAVTANTATPESASELRVICPRVLVANVLLAGMGCAEPVRVVVDSIDKASESCGWSHSQHLVFRRVSALATRALSYFLKRANQSCRADPSSSPTATALEDLLIWLCGYQDLFSRPCSATGQLLAWDPSSHIPLPPIFRPYVLTQQELVKAATDQTARLAYHMQTVPVELLTWQEDGPEDPLQLPAGGK